MIISETLQRQQNLRICLRRERASDVRRTVVYDDVAPVWEFFPQPGEAPRRVDVLRECDDTWYFPNWAQVDTYDCARHGCHLASDLKPSSRRRAQVHDSFLRGVEKVVLFVELYELERRTRAVALLLGELVEAVEAVLALRFLVGSAARHGGTSDAKELWIIY